MTTQTKPTLRFLVLAGISLFAAMAWPAVSKEPLQIVFPESTKPLYPQDEALPTWEQRHTFAGGGRRPGPYNLDPFIWTYTAEFSRRFGMPEKWIDPDLKGIEAAAWRRISEGFKVCGWGGKEDACQESTTCDLEVYVDETKYPLPWSTDRPVEIAPQYRSLRFLSPQRDEKARPKTSYQHGWLRSPFADPATGVEAMYWGQVYRRGKLAGGDSGIVVGFDRNVFSGLTLLVFRYYRCGYSHANHRDELAKFLLEARPKSQEVLSSLIAHKKLANGKDDELKRMATERLTKRGLSLDLIDENDPRLAEKRFHEFSLSEDYNNRIADYWKTIEETERDFYRRSLDMK